MHPVKNGGITQLGPLRRHRTLGVFVVINPIGFCVLDDVIEFGADHFPDVFGEFYFRNAAFVVDWYRRTV
jgi:hypothetical protein